MEKEGRALLVAPSDISGMSTLKRDRAAIQRLYDMGYGEGRRVLSFALDGKGK